ADGAARHRHRARRRVRPGGGDLQAGAQARRVDSPDPRGRQYPSEGGDHAPPRSPEARGRRPGGRFEMRRLAVLLAALVPLSGCFVSLGNVGFLERDRQLDETTVEGEGRDKILLVDVSEVITDTPTQRAFGLVEEPSTLARIESELKRAGDDDRVRALVLRINSPGGGATASDQIYSEIVRFKRERKIPVITALGDLAASGGYYIACAGDRIVAHPTTVTGSIGVILMNLNLEGLLGKIG